MDSRKLGNPRTGTFQVQKYPFYLLNRLVSRYNVIIEGRLKAVGLDIPYWRVLMILGEKSPRSVGQLAETAVIPFSTMTRIIQRMSGAGLIACAPTAADNRVVEVSLTAAGESKLAEARTLAAPVYEQVIKGFSGDEFDALIDSLGRLHENLADLLPSETASRRPAGAKAEEN